MTVDAWPSDLPCGQVDFSLSGGARGGGDQPNGLPGALDGQTAGPFWRARVSQLPLRTAVQIAAARALEGRLDGGAAPVLLNVCAGDLSPQVAGGTTAVATLTADAAIGATSLHLALSGDYLPLRGGEWMGYVHADPTGERGYMVAAITGGTTSAPIVRITPPLRAAIASGQALSFADVRVPMHLAGALDLTVELGRFAGLAADFEEWFEETVVLALRALALSPSTIGSGAAEDTLVGVILNRTAGSALVLTDDAGGRFKLVLEGSTWKVYAGATATDFSAHTSHEITVRETLGGYANSPRDNVLTIEVQVVGSRYWRLAFTRGVLDGFTQITAIEVAESEAGPDVSAEATISAGGAGTETVVVGAAFDGNNATQWIRNVVTGEFYANFDFGASASGWKLLTEARITGSFNLASRSPGAAELLYSDDGVTYVSLAAAEYGDSWVKLGARTVPEATPPIGYYRVHRLFIQTNNGDPNLVTIGEIEMLDETFVDILPTGHIDDSDGRVIVASTLGGGNSPYYGYDNSLGSCYAANGFQVTNQFFGMVFPEPVKVSQIRVTAATSSDGNPAGRSPRDVRREASHTQYTGEWDLFASTTWSGWAAGVSKVL